MKKLLIFLFFPIILFGCSTSQESAKRPAIISLVCDFSDHTSSFGTAFALTQDGLLMTAAHVVQKNGASRLKCDIGDAEHKDISSAKVVWEPKSLAGDFPLDVAFLKVPGSFETVEFGEGGTSPNEKFIIKGYQVNSPKTFSADFSGKIVESKDALYFVLSNASTTNFDALSGSPAFLKGKVIGIFTKSGISAEGKENVFILSLKGIYEIAKSLGYK